jgi:hypothetical protein
MSRKRKRSVRPDRLDFRDWPFRPAVSVAPAERVFPKLALAVKDQEDTEACTGFALSLVVEYLLRRAGRPASRISPYMLYSMARRYDEWSGTSDTGSSVRGALKGWNKHGACAEPLWEHGVEMPPVPDDPDADWWLDAVKRPLGAYYRIDPRQIRDIHAALNEVGIVYASVDTHKGWDEGDDLRLARRPRSIDKVFEIPQRPGSMGGHAIAFVGYDERGFLLQNSWGTDWGSHGHAILGYDDWRANAMDCWVAQLGVVTSEHLEIAASNTLRTRNGRVALAGSTILRNREISPFVVDLGKDGRLSDRGQFRTKDDDLRALVHVHLAEARAKWKLGNKPIDVCVYAHGGLVGEDAAATQAAAWIPLLYEHRIFPIFLMWETDLLTTVQGWLSDVVRSLPRPVGAGPGLWSSAERWWNQRVENLLAPFGAKIWGEMKQKARAISASPESGARRLWEHFEQSGAGAQSIRFHLVGHSAGSIVHAHVIDALARAHVRFESVSFLAPAIREDLFDDVVRPRLEDGTIGRYQQLHLTDKAEEDDPTCGPYRRSLLYLVSEAFEGRTGTRILGMQKYFDAYRKRRLGKVPAKRLVVHEAPGAGSTSTTHGGFDDDAATRDRVVEFIRR